MSLLEDVFLEDEAGEAQELERVIEGDEFEERPVSPTSDDNEEKDDEAEEDKRRVDPGQGKEKRIVKNPRVLLNPARLTGPRGIHVIPDHFKDFKFKGKGYEKEDLDLVLKKLEHWAYRLFPKFEFKDCLKKIETLGKKRPVMVHLHKIRSDQYTTEDTVVQRDSSDDEAIAPTEPPEEDEFDKLLQQQIDLARATPAPGSVRKPGFITPSSVDRSHIMPKATSSPSINDEQRERMLRNRRLAEERRLAKLNNDSNIANTSTDTSKQTNHIENVEIEGVQEIPVVKKHNRSNVIDSSDDDDDEIVINQAITVDVHKNIDVEMNNDKINSKTNVQAESHHIDEITNDESIEKERTETEIVNDIADNDKEETLIVEQNKSNHDDVNKSTNSKLDTENDSIDKNDDKLCADNEDCNDVLETHSKSDNNMPDNDEKENITSNKENIDVNAVEEIMDIDFNDKADNFIVKQNKINHNDVYNKSKNSILDTENGSINEVDKNNDKLCADRIDFNDILETNSKSDNDMPDNDEKENTSLKKDINTHLTSDKENIDVSAVEEIMDIDFGDDF